MSRFQWKVAVNGYEWVDGFDSPAFDGATLYHGGRVLVPTDWLELIEKEPVPPEDGEPTRKSWLWAERTYDVFQDQSGLFRNFAQTAPTEDGIREFANQYGLLGEGGTCFWPSHKWQPETDEEREQNDWSHQFMSIPQDRKEWQEAIESMRQAVQMWERLGQRRNGSLAQELESLIDRQLDEIRTEVRFRFDRSSQGPSLHVVPFTLLGAMWVQLAEAVSGCAEMRACPGCGKWFSLGPEANRITRRHCSDRCRTRAYRDRLTRTDESKITHDALPCDDR